MGKITGMEKANEVPQKVQQIYRAVLELIEEGADVTNLRVSSITDRAGVGKGTAYEYFDTKEEILSCAVVNHLQRTFDWLGNKLLEKESFEEQLDFLLDEMGKKDGRKFCFFRFVHILTDHSEFSQMVQQKLRSENFEPHRPLSVFRNVLQRGVDRGELRRNLPLDYMVYCVFSHLVAYIMAITAEDDSMMDPVRMRPFVRQGILDELSVTVQTGQGTGTTVRIV